MHLHADSERCSGCRACLLACSLHLFGENNPKRAALAIVPHFPVPGDFEVRTCTECDVCTEVCPVGAIHCGEDGVHRIDYEICSYCGVCIVACPEGLIQPHPEAPAPVKCDLCGDCVTFCGMNVLSIVEEEMA
jgi:Fe-S-cluster-containing dehydrogenase component